MPEPRIRIPKGELAAFCKKWKIAELALFGSVLTDEFRPDSDVDVLVMFERDLVLDLTHFLDTKEALERLFGRRVDLMTRQAIERSRNPLRKQHILDSAQTVYEMA
ncbi:MAG: nucleotidyltransferase domain-containing protein [Alphaproteobacteria bacterium]|nr:nucleotidyltransferase domain-containing protein [Alphaproteobacteria bacterium]